MLNKKDLSKQFELVVQQEIKNHNDAILATNMAMDDHKKSIQQLGFLTGQHIAELESKITDLKIKAENQQSNLELLSKRYHNHVTDMFQSLGDSVVKQNESAKAFDEIKLKYDEVAKDIVYQKNNLINLSIKLADIIQDIQDQICIMSDNILLRVETMIKRAVEKPTEAQQLKKDLEPRIEACKVEKDGLQQELDIIKKASFIQEKKIENLYTLLDRLNKR